MNEIKEKFNNVIDSGGINEIYIGSEETAPEEAKIIIDSNQMATPTNLIAENLDGNETDKAPCVQAVNNEFARIKGQILWTNSNPTSGISANTTISLSSSDYDVLEIIWKRTSTQNVIYSYRTLKGSNVEMFCNSTQGDNAPWVRSRVLSYVDDTTFTADVGYLQFCNSTSRSNEKTGCIPLYIVGYKTGLFSKEVNE